MKHRLTTCRICGMIFESKLLLARHLRKNHHITSKEYYDKYIDTQPHICPYCNERERQWYRGWYYGKTCGDKKCVAKIHSEVNPMHNPDLIAKIGLTKQLRYGNSGYNNHEKTVRTCQEKWGVANVYQREDIKEMLKQTFIEKYGVDNPAKSNETKKKSEETCLKRWGKRHYLETEDSIKKRIEYNREHYDCDWFVQTKEFASKRMTKIEYDGKFFDSRLEVNFYKFCKENAIQVEYHPFSIKFICDDNTKHFYLVDFLVNGNLLVETKGKHLIDENGNLKLIFTKELTEEEIKRQQMILKCKQQCMKEHDTIIFTNEGQFTNLLKLIEGKEVINAEH